MEKTGNSDEYLDIQTKHWTEGESLERFVSCWNGCVQIYHVYSSLRLPRIQGGFGLALSGELLLMLGPGSAESIEQACVLFVGCAHSTALPKGRAVQRVGLKYSVSIFLFGGPSSLSVNMIVDGCLLNLAWCLHKKLYRAFAWTRMIWGWFTIKVHCHTKIKMTETEEQIWSLFFCLPFHFGRKPSTLVGNNERWWLRSCLCT